MEGRQASYSVGRLPERLRVMIALILIWAVAATAGLSLYAYQRSVQDRANIWWQEAAVLHEIGSTYWMVSYATEGFLKSGETAFGTLASELLFEIHEGLLPISVYGYPSFTALGFSRGTFRHFSYAYVIAFGRIKDDPSLLEGSNPEKDYLIHAKDAYLALADLLSVIKPDGTDPLAQLGDERVNSIRGIVSELCGLSDDIDVGGARICG